MQHIEVAHSVSEACRIAHIGRTSLYEAIHSGALRAVKRGRRTLILHSDLVGWLHSLPPVALKVTEEPTEERNFNNG